MTSYGLHLGIDAINIRSGGGITHLTQMLNAANPIEAGFDRVTVWTSKKNADVLPTRHWIVKCSESWMDASLPLRSFGQQFLLPQKLIAHGCHVLFSPAGILLLRCKIPTVTMSQNMLPFEPWESKRFGYASFMRLKMSMLRYWQVLSFRLADGIIFLTHYAKNRVETSMGGFSCPTTVIPHGIESRFFNVPKTQRRIENYSNDEPFRLLYVSITMPYKHQIAVAKSVANLRSQGLPIEMRFVGPSWGNYGKAFKRLIKLFDPNEDFLKWSGHESFESMHRVYQESDAFVFASSCENLPNILIEAMASGLPIACSNRGPMPEILGDAGVYFDPEQPTDIARALRELLDAPELRQALAEKSYRRAQQYSWERCAKETFEFIAQVARQSKK